MNSDSGLQESVRKLFVGLAPERQGELTTLWELYSPQFHLVSKTVRDRDFVLETWHCMILLDVRTLRAFWLGAFIAWEGFCQIHEQATTGAANFARLEKMHGTLDRILTREDAWAVEMPAAVPEPGYFPDGKESPMERLPAELACFSLGWALLHEIRHLQHQQQGTATRLEATEEQRRDEELSCDAFATKFLLDRVVDFASVQDEDANDVRMKRETGIYFALFTMTLLGPRFWPESASHPAMQKRIDTIVDLMGATGTRKSDAVARGAFEALRLRYSGVPVPFAHEQ